MSKTNNEQLKRDERQFYRNIIRNDSGTCGCEVLRGKLNLERLKESALQVDYSSEETDSIPSEANLGLGCRNPIVLSGIRHGDIVLDLGSGGGFDCFIAGRRVGENGRVIGVDMTCEMVEKARQIARADGFSNVEFRHGEIENLPVESETIDVVISNCVINLSPDKQRVYGEAFRVLRPGGRLSISDMIAHAPIPDQIKNDRGAFVGCLAGASIKEELLDLLETIGFTNISIDPTSLGEYQFHDFGTNYRIDDFVAPALITAIKPKVSR